MIRDKNAPLFTSFCQGNEYFFSNAFINQQTREPSGVNMAIVEVIMKRFALLPVIFPGV